MIPVKGHIGLYRDEKTSAIINKDDSSFEQYLNSKNKLIESQNKISKLEKDIEEIKSILIQLLENK